MKTKIYIDTRTFVRFWLVVFGIGLAAILLYRAQVALIILGVSLFLAVALNGPVSKLAHLLPGRSRVGATAIAYVAVVIFLGLVVTMVIPPMIQQTMQSAQNIPGVVESATHQWEGLRHFVDQYNLQSQLDAALASAQSSATEWAANLGKGVVAGIGSLFSFIAALILVLVLTFLMLIEGPRWLSRYWTLYTDTEKMKNHKRLLSRVYGVVNGYVTGQLTVSSIGAASAGLFVFILSFLLPVPSNLAMPTAAVTFVLSLIPMFGATIGGILISILLALNSIPAAIVYVIFFVVYQQIENNFISPNIQAKRIDLSALMVLSAVTIGLYMFGVAGGIIAIPIAGTVRIFFEEYIARRNAASDPADAKVVKAASTASVTKVKAKAK